MHWIRSAILVWAVACTQKAPSTDPATTTPEPADSGTACDPSADTDGDGLDDCTELDLGTRLDAADTDGDGTTDADELACLSDPLDAMDACYACGWPHNDPGTLSGAGPNLGDTVGNLELIDQCGDRVRLWDLAGSWHVLFMTASWCSACLAEAEHFNTEQAAVEARIGAEFSFITVVFQDSAGNLPGPDEGERYAGRSGIEGQPVFSDPVAAVLGATPFDGDVLPGVCALSPELELLDCADGSRAVEEMLAVVEAAAAR